MGKILNTLAAGIVIHIQSMTKPDPNPSNQEYLHDINDQYISTFRSIAKHLNDEISSSETTTRSLLYYLSATFLQFLLNRMTAKPLTIPEGKDIVFSKELAVLLATLVRCKEQTAAQYNRTVREQLRDHDYTRINDAILGRYTHTVRFSARWWDGFFLAYDESGLRGIENDPQTSSSTPLDVTPRPLASAPDGIRPPNPDISQLSSSAISPRISPESTIIVPSTTSNPDDAFVPDVILDPLLPRHADKPPAEATLADVANEPPIESPAQDIPSQSLPLGLLVRGDVPSQSSLAPGDSVLDMELSR
jgi:hypothetical protein